VSTAQLITSADVNTEDLLRYKKIVVTNEALTQLAQRLNK
jgi:ribosomal protein L4